MPTSAAVKFVFHIRFFEKGIGGGIGKEYSEAMKKFVAIAGLLLVLAGVAFLAEKAQLAPSPKGSEGDGAAGRTMSLEDYFKQNISVISPVKEVLGGKFYVTKIEAHGGAGTVAYEDGHNAYVADFTYSTDERGAVSVETFKVRE